MFARENRVRSNKDILDLFKSAEMYHARHLRLFFKKNKHGHLRTAFVISKKFSLLAVKRNQQKRILRSAFQAVLQEKGVLLSYDILVSYTKSGKMVSFEEAKQIYEDFLSKKKITTI